MSQTTRPWRIRWFITSYFISIHVLSLYFIWWMFFIDQTLTNVQLVRHFIIFWILTYMSLLGILVGAHRLWSHRSFKACLPLRILLMLFHTLAFQSNLVWWCRNHRQHHKYSDTDADPHNSKRGMFFSHIGWLLINKHPEVSIKGQKIDISDLLADPVVRFQKRFFIPLVVLIWAALPTYISHLITDSSLWTCFLISVIFRQAITANYTFTSNSLAHAYGYRSYDKSIMPVENHLASYLVFGEGYHNYHHAFPSDYSASELGWQSSFNINTAFIDLCAWLGLAYDLKKQSKLVIEKRIKRTGDEYLWRAIQPKTPIRDYLLGILVSHFFPTLIFAVRMLKNAY